MKKITIKKRDNELYQIQILISALEEFYEKVFRMGENVGFGGKERIIKYIADRYQWLFEEFVKK
jgi:hypothetical protein